MNSIYYFNINFSCNNKCVYCFSHSTGEERRDVIFEQFTQNLQSVKPGETDKICINGGEPSLHPHFYQILRFIEKHFSTHTVVYTNGTLLKREELRGLKRTSFVIPIHGNEELHNKITRNKSSYSQTISGLQALQQEKLPFAIKFILNKEMVESEFKIPVFLQIHNLHPNKIFLARLNKTQKAVLNQVQYPSFEELQKYLTKCHNDLSNTFELIYLDIPLCFIYDKGDKLSLPQIPIFLYSDYRKTLVEKNYYKEIKILGDRCKNCPKEAICSIMQDSYLTLSFRKEWKLVVE